MNRLDAKIQRRRYNSLLAIETRIIELTYELRELTQLKLELEKQPQLTLVK